MTETNTHKTSKKQHFTSNYVHLAKTRKTYVKKYTLLILTIEMPPKKTHHNLLQNQNQYIRKT
jgi:hypothetical protein